MVGIHPHAGMLGVGDLELCSAFVVCFLLLRPFRYDFEYSASMAMAPGGPAERHSLLLIV